MQLLKKLNKRVDKHSTESTAVSTAYISDD